jgi:hypothetical protein
MLPFPCPNCGSDLAVPEGAPNQPVACLSCGEEVAVPGPSESYASSADGDPSDLERYVEMEVAEKAEVQPAGGPAAGPTGARPDRRLPRPLGDPLRSARTFFLWLVTLCLVLGLVVGVVSSVRTAGDFFLNMLVADAVCFVLFGAALVVIPPLPMIWLVLHILPKRGVNAFYLRSFRNDRYSWPARKAIQAALGGDFRLSGIRDPTRRMPVLLRGLLFGIFLFRYCTPKFMNLEAGWDWQARLWRSLADARCAFIDLSDLTPFVEAEVHLCYRCLGPARVLFLGDPSRGPAQWQNVVAQLLSLKEPARTPIPEGAGVAPPASRFIIGETRCQVAIWQDTGLGRRAFHDAVRLFASGLPPGPAGLKVAACPDVKPPEAERAGRQAVTGEEKSAGGLTVLGAFLVIVLLLAAAFLSRSALGRLLSLPLWIVPALALGGYMTFLLISYFIDCGSARERAIVCGCLGLLVVFYGGSRYYAAPALFRYFVNKYTLTSPSDCPFPQESRTAPPSQRERKNKLTSSSPPDCVWRVAALAGRRAERWSKEEVRHAGILAAKQAAGGPRHAVLA